MPQATAIGCNSSSNPSLSPDLVSQIERNHDYDNLCETIMTPQLQTLPREILELIGRSASLAALSSIARTNHYFFNILNPILYQRDKENDPPFWCVLWAAEKGSLDTLKRASSYGLDLNSDGSSGILIDYKLEWGRIPWRRRYFATPLHIATQYNHFEVVEWLLANGVDVKAWSRDFCPCPPMSTWYPLHTALNHNGRLEIVSLFLSHGATDAGYMRPGLHAAVALGEPDLVDLFLNNARVDVNERDIDKAGVLHHLSACQDNARASEIFDKLINRNAEVNIVDKNDQTPFITALDKRKFGLALQLFKKGAQLDLGTPGIPLLGHCFNHTPADWSAEDTEVHENNRVELVKILLANGTDANIRFTNEYGGISSLLYIAAAFAQSLRCVQILFDAGAVIDQSVHSPEANGEESFLRVMLRDVASNEYISDVFLKGTIENMIRLLVERGARLDRLDDEESALEYAVDCADEGETGLLRLFSEIATEQNVSAAHVMELLDMWRENDEEREEEEEGEERQGKEGGEEVREEREEEEKEAKEGEEEGQEDEREEREKSEVEILLEQLLAKVQKEEVKDNGDDTEMQER